jgi:hypothetical protein
MRLIELNRSPDSSNTSTKSVPSKIEGIHNAGTNSYSSNCHRPSQNATSRKIGREFIQDDPQEVAKSHRSYSMNMSNRWTHKKRVLLKDIDFESR